MVLGGWMKTYIFEYAIATVIFLALDYLWLRTMGPGFYSNEIGPLLRSTPNLPVALAFYLLFVAGLVFFVIDPSLAAGSILRVALSGAFFGLVAYATYDLTSLATIKGFTAKVALVDMAWGAILSASVSVATVHLMRGIKLA
jgi:uncharacterized membrane protein